MELRGAVERRRKEHEERERKAKFRAEGDALVAGAAGYARTFVLGLCERAVEAWSGADVYLQ